MENSTRVNVNFQFARPFANGLQHSIMLFSEWRSAFHIRHKQGRVDHISVEEL